MATEDIRRASLEQIRRLKDEGRLTVPSLPEIEKEDLGPDFWANAQVVEPSKSRSVRLNPDPEVFEFFKQRGRHITRMQEVLKAYVRAHQKSGF